MYGANEPSRRSIQREAHFVLLRCCLQSMLVLVGGPAPNVIAMTEAETTGEQLGRT